MLALHQPMLMKTKLISLFILNVICFTSSSQTFTGTGGLIPDDGVSVIEFPLNVSGLPSSILDATFGIESVCIDITHTWNADLLVSIIAPDGTEVILTANNGGDSDDYANTCFDQSAVNSIVTGWGPFTGTFKPQVNLGYINNGQNGNGLWKLHIYDNYPADQGNLISWNITFGNNPATVVPFTDSNLPIVVINTNNQPIPDDPKLLSDMGIIYNGPGIRNYMTDPFNHYDGKIGIELRGSSSQMFPKKTYGLETWDTNSVSIDTMILGMPSESDWVLSASYSDKSLMNNMLAYKLFNDFGYYAPRTRYVELVVNNQYQGVYILMEKIKRDVNRVNVSKMTTADIAGDGLTGGYIIKIDKTTGSGGNGFSSNYAPAVQSAGQTIYFQYEYPSDINIQPQQETYIQNFVDSFETALASFPLQDLNTGWRAYADEFSFIHYFILNELSKNVDGYRLSTYLYKTKNTSGDRLFIGPPWDYDLAFHNADYCDGAVVSGWAHEFGNVCPGDGYQVPFWWERMMQDTLFVNNLKCIYTQLRSDLLSTATLDAYIDSVAFVLDEGQQRNFSTWEILGSYVWPNPAPIPVTYAQEIGELKTWLFDRLNWLDNNIPGNCTTLSASEITGDDLDFVSLYPNPAEEEMNVSIYLEEGDELSISMMDINGKIVFADQKNLNSGTNYLKYDVSDLSSGMYFVSVNGKKLNAVLKLMK